MPFINCSSMHVFVHLESNNACKSSVFFISMDCTMTDTINCFPDLSNLMGTRTSSQQSWITLQALLAIITHEDWELNQVDMCGAYLEGELEEEIYMKLPEVLVELEKEGWLWELLRVLYGLKQADKQ
jgi:hypothetical protein